MALATEPRLLLLDEPMAGMGPDESVRMVQMLRQIKGSIAILLIEHDMEAVFALADRLTVLVYGRIIASGDPGDCQSRRRACARPISAKRSAPRAVMADAALLEVAGDRNELRLEPRAVRHFACGCAGRNGLAHGQERHG